MQGKPNDLEIIRKRINELEADRQGWLLKLATARGVDRRLVQTALTQIEARLRWYRGRAEGRKVQPEANRMPARRRVKALNRERLAEARS